MTKQLRKKFILKLVLYYFLGIIIELIIKSVVEFDFQGFITHFLPIWVTLKSLKKQKLKPHFLKVQKPLKERFKYLPAAMGFDFFLGGLLYYILIKLLELLNFDNYNNFLNSIMKLFTETDWNIGIIQIILLIISGMILAPIVEELLLRGFVYDHLEEKFPKSYVMINTLLFGLLHGGFMPQHYVGGYVLAKLREKEGDIYGAIIIHMVNNCFAILQGVFPLLSDFFIFGVLIYFFIYIIFNSSFVQKRLAKV